MKGIIFLDKDFKELKLPKHDEIEWIEFTDRARYAFFNIPERMRWFISEYRDLDDLNSIFAKTGDGVYTYSEEDDYWFKETDNGLIGRVRNIYWASNIKEENNT